MELLLQFLAESPTTYTWSNGTNASTTFEVQGNMTVVTDVLNNKVTANFIITEPTLITIPSQ
jgi:hypothetical protein